MALTLTAPGIAPTDPLSIAPAPALDIDPVDYFGMEPPDFRDDYQKQMDTWRMESATALDKAVLDPVSYTDERIPGGWTPDEWRKTRIVDDWMRLHTDGEEPPMGPAREFTRAMLAERHFGGEGKDSDDALFSKITAEATKRSEENEFSKKLAAAVADDVSLPIGEGKGLAGFLKEAAGKPGYDAEKTADYAEAWTEARTLLAERMAPYKEPLEAVWKARGNLGKVSLEVLAGIRDEDLPEFLQALRLRAETLGDEEKETFLAGMRKDFARTWDNALRGTGETLTEYGLNQPTDPMVGIADAIYGTDNYAESEAGRKAAIPFFNASRNRAHEVRRIMTSTYDPIDYVKGWGWAQKIPGLTTTSLAYAVPGAGSAFMVGSLQGMAQEKAYLNARDSGMSEADAASYSSAIAPAVMIPQAILEKIGIGIWTRKLPMLNSVLTKMDDAIVNRGLRFLTKTATVGAAETTVEVAQDLTEVAITDIASALNSDLPDVDWNRELQGAWRSIPEIAGSMILLSMFGAAGGLNTEARAAAYQSASDRQLTAKGFTPEAIAGIRSAQGPASTVAAVQAGWQTRNPHSPEAKAASEEEAAALARARAAGEALRASGALPSIVVGKDGFTVLDGETKDEVGTAKTMGEAWRIAQAHSDFLADLQGDAVAYMATLLESADFVAKLDPNTKTELDLGTVMDRALLEATKPEMAARFALQAAMKEQAAGGDGSISYAINGWSETEIRDNLRQTTNRIFSGASALTVFHEFTHGKRREARAAGRITRADELSFIRAIDTVLGTRKTKEGERMAFLESGLTDDQVTEEMIDEAMSEIMEMEILRSREGGTKRTMPQRPGVVGVPSGFITRNLKAIGRLAPEATRKFSAFIEAVRSHFGTAMARALALKKAEREGKFDSDSYDAFLAKMMGLDLQDDHNARVDEEAARIYDGDPRLSPEAFAALGDPTQEVEGDDIPFSIAQGNRSGGFSPSMSASEWSRAWNLAYRKNDDLRQHKEWVISRLRRMTEANGWQWGWGVDQSAKHPFKWVIYFDTPVGQISFHQYEPDTVPNPAYAKAMESRSAAEREVVSKLDDPQFPPLEMPEPLRAALEGLKLAPDSTANKARRAILETPVTLRNLYWRAGAFNSALYKLQNGWSGVPLEQSQEYLRQIAAYVARVDTLKTGVPESVFVPSRIIDPNLKKYSGKWDGVKGAQADRLGKLEEMFPGSLSPEGQAPAREPGNGAGERWHLAKDSQAQAGPDASAFSIGRVAPYLTMQEFSDEQRKDMDFFRQFMPRMGDRLAFAEALAKVKRRKVKPLDDMMEDHEAEWMGDAVQGDPQLYKALVKAGLLADKPVDLGAGGFSLAPGNRSGQFLGIDTNYPGGANIGDAALPGNSAVTLEDIQNGVAIPNGWFLHGRNPDKKFGAVGVVFTSRDIEIADYYAGSKGSIYAVRGEGLEVFTEERKEQIINDLINDRENDALSPNLDALVDRSSRDDLIEGIDPEDLIESGNLWDDHDFTSWFWDKYESPGIVFDRGLAVFLNGSETERVNLTAGESIPFNQSPPAASGAMSLAPSRALDLMQMNALDRVRNPRRRAEIFTRMSREFQRLKLAAERLEIVSGTKRLRKSLLKEAAMREAKAREDLEADVYARFWQIFADEDLVKIKSQPGHAFLADPDSPLRGRLMSRAAAMKHRAELFGEDYKGGEWDGSDGLSRALFGGTRTPDQAAREMYDAGLIKSDDVNEMWALLHAEQNTVAGMKEQLAKAQEQLREARIAAKEEANAWLKHVAKGQQETFSPREEILRMVASLEAILRPLPAPVRVKVGGYQQMIRIAGTEGQLKFLREQISKADRELEKWMRETIGQEFRELMEKTKPERDEAGKRPKGKIGADIHDIFRSIENAIYLDGAETQAEVTRLKTLAEAETTTEEQRAHLLMEAELVDLTGNWAKANSERREAALTAATNAYYGGYMKAQMKAAGRRARNEFRRADLKAATGKAGERMERVAAEVAGLGTKLGRAKQAVFSLFSFDQMLELVFGTDSETAKLFTEWELRAANAKEDAMQRSHDAVESLLTDLAGGELAGENLRHKLATERSVTWTDHKGQTQTATEMEAVSYTLMWRQEDGKRHMEGLTEDNPDGSTTVLSEWHWREEDIEAIEKQLSKEAKAIRLFLTESYSAEYDRINAVYSDLYDVNMPRHKDYSPIKVAPSHAAGGQTADPVSGTMQGPGLTPGSLKNRSHSAVAEPARIDALQHFVAHTKQMEHFIAYAAFSTELMAVVNNREVGNTIEAKAGKEAVNVIRGWADYFAQGGTRDAAAHLAASHWFQRGLDRISQMALVGRASVLAIQSVQLGAALYQMPAGSYLKRLAKLSTGQLGWGKAIRSEYIQRRLAQMPPAVQQAMAGLAAGSPSRIKHATAKLGRLISGADALFTAGTYAMIYDYQLTAAKRMGIPNPEAYAEQETIRLTDQVAQPMRAGARSMMEVTSTNPAFRMMWAFASEPRQKIAMAVHQAMTKKGAGRFRAAAVTWLVSGMAASIIRSALRDLRDDGEDDEVFDEKNWSPERLILSSLAGPLGGLPLIGKEIESALYAGAGEYMPGGSLIGGPTKAVGTVKKLATGGAEWEDAIKDTETILGGIGAAFPTAAAATSWMHIARDVVGIIRNLTED